MGSRMSRTCVRGTLSGSVSIPWVEGTVYDWGTVDPKISYQMGGLLAALHVLPVPAEALKRTRGCRFGGLGGSN